MDVSPDEPESRNAEVEKDVDGKDSPSASPPAPWEAAALGPRLTSLVGTNSWSKSYSSSDVRLAAGRGRECGIVATEVTVVALVNVVIRVIVVRVQIEVRLAVRIVIDAEVTAVVVFLGDVAYGCHGVGKNGHATNLIEEFSLQELIPA